MRVGRRSKFPNIKRAHFVNGPWQLLIRNSLKWLKTHQQLITFSSQFLNFYFQFQPMINKNIRKKRLLNIQTRTTHGYSRVYLLSVYQFPRNCAKVFHIDNISLIQFTNFFKSNILCLIKSGSKIKSKQFSKYTKKNVRKCLPFPFVNLMSNPL